MNKFISLCVVGAFLLLLCIQQGEGIRCWVCSSDYDSRCGDPFNMTHFALTDCDRDRSQSPYLQSISACQKKKQKTHNGIVMVRACTWMNEESRDGTCREPTSSYDSKYEYCSVCTHDACNSAKDLRITSTVLLPLSAIVLRSLGKYM